MEHIQMFQDDMIGNILGELKEKQEFILKFIFKDPNEVWKYIYFLINLIKQLGIWLI